MHRTSWRTSPSALPLFSMLAARALAVTRPDAFVPMAEQTLFQPGEAEEDEDAEQRQQQERREHARDVEAVARFDDAPGEPGAGARAGDELGDHGADEGEAAGDLGAAQDVRQGARQLEAAEALPARRAIELEQLLQIVVDTLQPQRAVGQDREEGDDGGKD